MKRHRSRIQTIAVSALFGVCCLAAPAHALTVDFSFENVVGSVDGTVTGEILGLLNNSTGPATDIIITSTPGGMQLPSLPFSVFADASEWQGGYVNLNSFTLAGGVVTAATFQIEGGYFDLNAGGVWNVLTDLTSVAGVNPGNNVANAYGFYAVTYTTVPEPSTWAMLVAGFAALGFVGLRRSQPVATA